MNAGEAMFGAFNRAATPRAAVLFSPLSNRKLLASATVHASAPVAGRPEVRRWPQSAMGLIPETSDRTSWFGRRKMPAARLSCIRRHYDATVLAMINLLSILFSTGMVIYIVVRAAKLDRNRPWFETRSIYEQEQAREAAARRAASDKAVRGRQSHLLAGIFKEHPAPRLGRPNAGLRP
jgi:hypothetical protein